MFNTLPFYNTVKFREALDICNLLMFTLSSVTHDRIYTFYDNNVTCSAARRYSD